MIRRSNGAIPTKPITNSPSYAGKIDELIADLESRGLGWSLDHNGDLIEARIWRWPYVVGRYRPGVMAPLAELMQGALQQVDLDYYVVLEPDQKIKPHYKHND